MTFYPTKKWTDTRELINLKQFCQLSARWTRVWVSAGLSVFLWWILILTFPLFTTQVLSDELSLSDNLYENANALINAKDLNKLTMVNDIANTNKNKAAPYLSLDIGTDTGKTRNVSCQTYSTGDIISAVTIDDD